MGRGRLLVGQYYFSSGNVLIPLNELSGMNHLKLIPEDECSSLWVNADGEFYLLLFVHIWGV